MRVPEPKEFFQNLEYDTKTLQDEGLSRSAIDVMRNRRIKRFLNQVEYYERMSGRRVDF